MQGFFPEFGTEYNFPSAEAAVLEFWKKNKIFDRVLQSNGSARVIAGTVKDASPSYWSMTEKNGKSGLHLHDLPIEFKRQKFGFYDGPPFATGLPHYGHIIAGTIKDIVPRYWTMRGYQIERRFGWDCHGLPVEFEIEKSHNLNGSLAIREFGVANFNEACRSIVLRFTSDWRKTVERMGRWVDLDNDYKTMNPEFMETVWWVFSQLWEKGLVYQGKKVVPYSWRLTAPLSNFEASQNYKSVQDPAITILLPLADQPDQAFAAWTTTPWTLPANLGLAVNPEFTYCLVPLKNPQKIKAVWVAESRLSFYSNELDTANIYESKKGEKLIGKKYQPLFPFYEKKATSASFSIIPGDFVLEGDGTGIVHMAPAFGEDDFYACQKHNIGLEVEERLEPADPTNLEGFYTSDVSLGKYDLKGKHVKDPETDKQIIEYLKQDGHLLKRDVLQHNYPFCERSDTPLIYKAISSWFVNVEKIKDRMIEHNQKIHWVPGHIRDGRFGKWLENARDWCISRNRFWGTPIPVWICQKCGHKHVVGSRKALNALAGREVADLHSHFVDDILADCPKCQAQKSLKRTPEVLDCWFESGSMPYAQSHYPFEGEVDFKNSFPADFIAEGLDQTRGWFYTLTVLSTALFDQPAFKNCIVNGMVLAEDGKKMSKRLKNYPDPMFILDKYGADALRLYFMQSPAVHGEELRFTERYLVENMRAVLIPLWNAYQFFASYSNIDGFQPKEIRSGNSLDRTDQWILALLTETESRIHVEMEKYELAGIAPILAEFVDNLTNWYIRLNRSRFWESKGNEWSESKLSAYTTLYYALDRISLILAPYLPFFAEYLHSSLHFGKSALDLKNINAENITSVHEKIFSKPKVLSNNELQLIAEMRLAQRAILLGRSLRAEAKIGIRQPLEKITLAGLTNAEIQFVKGFENLIKQELNVKEVVYQTDGSGLVEETVKPNLKVLGPRLGKKLGSVSAELKKWGSKEIAALEKNGTQSVQGETISLTDLLIERKAAAGKCAGALQGLVAELDTALTPELKREGLARELVNRIQQERKDKKLQLTDRIKIKIHGSTVHPEVSAIFADRTLSDYIKGETLAESIAISPSELTQSTQIQLEEYGEYQLSLAKA